MKILPGKTYSLFIVKEFLKVFFVSIIFIMGLSFIVRTLQQVDSFKRYSLINIIIIRILEAPEIISRECLLASSMFASVYTMSILTKNKEIVALRSCGVSIYTIVSPLIITGFLIAVFSLVFEDFVVVRAIKSEKRYKAKIAGVERNFYRDRFDLIVFGENNRVFKIDRYYSKKEKMVGILVLKKNENGKIVERIDAKEAEWNGKRWVFYDGIVRFFNSKGELVKEEKFKKYLSDIKDKPSFFARPAISVNNMSIKDGLRYIKSLKRMGLPYKADETKFHRKIARSATLFFVILIGLSLGSMDFKNALVISFSLTLGIVLVFFFIIEIGYTFGSTGKIPPALGGWLGNIVFSIVSIYLMNRIRV